MTDIQYSSQYIPENRNIGNVARNIVNAIMYMGLTIANTMMPYMVMVATGTMDKTVLTITIIILIIFFLDLIISIGTFAIQLYFFIKEKHKYQEKWYQ